jgi:hypothetical protein
MHAAERAAEIVRDFCRSLFAVAVAHILDLRFGPEAVAADTDSAGAALHAADRAAKPLGDLARAGLRVNLAEQLIFGSRPRNRDCGAALHRVKASI